MENNSGNAIKSTVNYYDENAQDFIYSTVNADMSILYASFEQYLFPGCYILDLGSGSGRDSKHFIDMGYNVVAIDPSKEMCVSIRKIAGIIPIRMMAEELNFEEEFDAIWACASLLHVRNANMKNVLMRCMNALKDKGYMYASWKYGVGERIEKERHYSDYNEETISDILTAIKGLRIISIWKTEDVRDSNNMSWINIIIQKNNAA